MSRFFVKLRVRRLSLNRGARHRRWRSRRVVGHRAWSAKVATGVSVGVLQRFRCGSRVAHLHRRVRVEDRGFPGSASTTAPEIDTPPDATFRRVPVVSPLGGHRHREGLRRGHVVRPRVEGLAEGDRQRRPVHGRRRRGVNRRALWCPMTSRRPPRGRRRGPPRCASGSRRRYRPST